MEHSMVAPVKSKTHKSTLSDLALLILKAAAERKDRLVFPLPESIETPANKVEKTVKDLFSRGLIEECPAKLEDVIWRTDNEQHHLTLRISAAGQEALDVQKDNAASAASRNSTKSPTKLRQAPDAKAQAAPRPSKTSPSRQKQATKAARILALLRRPQGASIAELTKSTGWQAHSIRGFLSATLKNKMKLKLKSERPEGKERRYKVA
jgi:hypothetical protein